MPAKLHGKMRSRTNVLVHARRVAVHVTFLCNAYHLCFLRVGGELRSLWPAPVHAPSHPDWHGAHRQEPRPGTLTGIVVAVVSQ
jgi:hypothetical protein